MKKAKLLISVLTGLSTAAAFSMETPTAMKVAAVASAVAGAVTVFSRHIKHKPRSEKAFFGIGVSVAGAAFVTANCLRNNDSKSSLELARAHMPSVVPACLFTATLAALGPTGTIGLASVLANDISYGCGLGLAKAGQWFTSKLDTV